MPWRETSVMDERLQFVTAYQAGEVGMTELCRAAGISRKTGYKWLERFLADGRVGLADLSRAPHVQARRTPEAIEGQLLAFKRRHAGYGPKKIRALLSQQYPDADWPAVSTISGLLAAHGLVKPQTRRRKTPPYPHPLLPMEQPNAVWTADFKGQFATGDGQLCYPLTIADGYSRYLITCRGMPEISRIRVFRSFKQAFREYGLPDAIRTDNGPPFSNRGLGISKLTAWWWKLGIRHERIEPGHPEQNGRHERLPEVTYPDGYVVRQVRQNGSIKWRSRLVYVCSSLVGDPVGLTQIDDQRWRVYFLQEPIGIFDEHLSKVLPM